MIRRATLTEPTDKPYVGLHTPDSDAIGIRTDAFPQFVDPIVRVSQGRWG